MRIRETIRKLIPPIEIDNTDENGNPIGHTDPTAYYKDTNPKLEILRQAEDDGVISIRTIAARVAVGVLDMEGVERDKSPLSPGKPVVREGHLVVTKFHRPQ